MSTIRYLRRDSPLGVLMLTRTSLGLASLTMEGGRHAVPIDPGWIPDSGAFDELSAQLDEYFAGQRRVFEVALDVAGTPFQRAVWQALCAIPYGQTVSYGELALRVNRPRAQRAVGAANGQNPVSIVVPCHRVVGADGSLTGYGGGMANKRFLLELESRQPRLL